MGGDAIEKAAKGATEGVLDWTKENLKELVPALVKRFRNREVAFVQNKKTADSIQKQNQTSEYKMLCTFIPKGPFRVLIRAGLALREIEGNRDEVAQLKDNIHAKYQKAGVRIAELAQIGITKQLVEYLVEVYKNPTDVKERVLAFFNQADQLTIFITKEDEDRAERMSKLVMERVDTNPSGMVILFASGSAVSVAVKILKIIKHDPLRYPIKITETGRQLVAFILLPGTEESSTSHWARLISSEKGK